MEIYQKLFNKDFLTNQPTVKPTVVMKIFHSLMPGGNKRSHILK